MKTEFTSDFVNMPFALISDRDCYTNLNNTIYAKTNTPRARKTSRVFCLSFKTQLTGGEKMKKIVGCLLFVFLVFVACEGPTGPDGEIGLTCPPG